MSSSFELAFLIIPTMQICSVEYDTSYPSTNILQNNTQPIYSCRSVSAFCDYSMTSIFLNQLRLWQTYHWVHITSENNLLTAYLITRSLFRYLTLICPTLWFSLINMIAAYITWQCVQIIFTLWYLFSASISLFCIF